MPMLAKNCVFNFIKGAIKPKVEIFHGALTIKLSGVQFDGFPTKNSVDFPKNASKIKRRNYYKKRYKSLVQKVLNTREDDKLHTYANTITREYNFDFYNYYNSAYFEDQNYLNNETVTKEELYDVLERLITIYEGKINKH
jgi:hypothetical protein